MVDAKLKTDERLADAKFEADKYDRFRSAFREDATFDLLKEALDYLEKALTESNAQAQSSHIYHVEAMQEISRFSATLERHTDLIRILTQEVSVLSDKVDRMRTRSDVGTDTKYLRNPDEPGC